MFWTAEEEQRPAMTNCTTRCPSRTYNRNNTVVLLLQYCLYINRWQYVHYDGVLCSEQLE